MHTVGRIQVQFELLPVELASLRPSGEGRSEPNRWPELPEPVREKFSLLNPFSSIVGLLGPAMARKVMTMGACIVLCILIGLCFPMIISNIIAKSAEGALGIVG